MVDPPKLNATTPSPERQLVMTDAQNAHSSIYAIALEDGATEPVADRKYDALLTILKGLAPDYVRHDDVRLITEAFSGLLLADTLAFADGYAPAELLDLIAHTQANGLVLMHPGDVFDELNTLSALADRAFDDWATYRRSCLGASYADLRAEFYALPITPGFADHQPTWLLVN